METKLPSLVVPEGYRLEVFESLYMDYGLRIWDLNGNLVYSNPCCISNEIRPDIEWLRMEAEELLEAYLPVPEPTLSEELARIPDEE